MGLRNKEIQILLKTGGHYVDGLWQDEAVDRVHPIRVYASVQPVTPKELQSLPENRREKEVLKVFIPHAVSLNNANQNPALVNIAGEDYEIIKKSKWDNGILSHYSLFVTKGGVYETV